MKTLNCHPIWRNQPLLLTPAQTENPNLVLSDFFQSYHLKDVREIMWQWMTEAVSGPNSHSIDHHDRNNYLFFYEKIEALVEAAWTMNQRGQPVVNLAKPAIQPTRFSKPARLIEQTTTQPVEVITEVFDQVTLNDLTEYLLPNWFQVAIVNLQSPYSNGNGRETLFEFFELLFQFVEELHALWTNQQLTNLSPTITDFFRQCPIDYLRRELADFLEAGIGHAGAYPNGFTPWQAWMTYNHLLCLIEAAYQLYINQQMETVSKMLSNGC